MSMYGCELWDNILRATSKFNSFAVNYHKSIKQIMKVPWRYGNHDVCEEAGLPIFKHFINLRLALLAFNITNSKSVTMSLYKSYMIHESHMMKNIKNIFSTVYNVNNLLKNDFDAVVSRINFVQAREQRTHYNM